MNITIKAIILNTILSTILTIIGGGNFYSFIFFFIVLLLPAVLIFVSFDKSVKPANKPKQDINNDM